MRPRPSPEEFTLAWTYARSITHASVILQKWGFPQMTPRRVLMVGRSLRLLGVKLKKLERSKLPSYYEFLARREIMR